MCVHDVVRESYVSLFNALLANLKHMTGKQLNDPEDVQFQSENILNICLI